MSEDIRWKQRFSNFKKATSQLTEFIERQELNKFEKQGLIQCFEYTFELAWKVMKDYLEEQGFTDIKSPRATIQTAFQSGLISDGHIWIDALDKRNLMAHTYDENITDESETLIEGCYYKMIKDLLDKLEELL